jgi:hypothetical protein
VSTEHHATGKEASAGTPRYTNPKHRCDQSFFDIHSCSCSRCAYCFQILKFQFRIPTKGVQLSDYSLAELIKSRISYAALGQERHSLCTKLLLKLVLTRIGCEANSGPWVDGELGAEISGCRPRRAFAYSLWLVVG